MLIALRCDLTVIFSIKSMKFGKYAEPVPFYGNHGSNFGCWMSMWGSQPLSSLCPLSRLRPTYVLTWSLHGPNIVIVLILTNVCLQILIFVLSESKVSPYWLYIVLLESNFSPRLKPQTKENWLDKRWSKLRLLIFISDTWFHCDRTKFGQSLDYPKS